MIYEDQQLACYFPAARSGVVAHAVAALLRVSICTVLVYGQALACEVQVSIKGDAANHVYPAGQVFSVQLRIDGAEQQELRYFWRNFRSQRISASELVRSGESTTITAPDGHAGYLGLVLEPLTTEMVLPGREPGEPLEYGFALLPKAPVKSGQPDPKYRFGVVHADLDDPYLQGWVKTMTWKTTSAKWWAAEMDKRRTKGLLELPIIVGADWKSADTEPVSSAQLQRLKSRLLDYFAADPATIYWETGIEENLRHRYETPYYWSNLVAKARVTRQAADATNPGIRLVYQIAELDPDDAGTFLRSAAVRYYDVLSLHPYAWPDFPDPERWLENYLDTINELMSASGRHMPLWFTEVGAPQRGNHASGFFGYPEKGVEVPGKSAYEAVIYLIKLHIMAYHLGVEKIFWYNYQDREPQREYAENHFGLRDYRGYPKPVYPAYINLQKQLKGKEAGRAWRLDGGIRVYEFNGSDTSVKVAWAYPAGVREIAIGDLFPGHVPDDIIGVVDPVGNLLPSVGDTITISGEPVFILSRPGQEIKPDKEDNNI